ncbi:hypothetical protein [Actinomadura sp. HBU206391]|uniref:hypothetical protein n=1 Tax=Actinomadura sp. HBU206391 TaxID=2731692 RepID=UPI00164F2954|nr:hypothetical protein [Actinomadura sp. HBU206391]MBC6458431.1 hypothetical protein [Actinomadura sp. HBU206391]
MPVPQIPDFRPGVVVGTVPDVLNEFLRDPMTALLDPPSFVARRTSAWNLTENVHQNVPWDSVSEDSHSGWVSGAVVGGGASSTLSVAAAVADNSITVASAASFSSGDWIRIDTGANAEYRRISAPAGNVLTFSATGGGTGLARTHSIGAAVTEVDGDPTRYTVPDGWSGWWLVDAVVSLSGTGAAGLVAIPGVSVNNQSQTGEGNAWEGCEPFVPTGASTEPKHANGTWRIYAAEGERVQLDLWFSTESAITAADVTTGRECRIGLVWDGV